MRGLLSLCCCAIARRARLQPFLKMRGRIFGCDAPTFMSFSFMCCGAIIVACGITAAVFTSRLAKSTYTADVALYNGAVSTWPLMSTEFRAQHPRNTIAASFADGTGVPLTPLPALLDIFNGSPDTPAFSGSTDVNLYSNSFNVRFLGIMASNLTNMPWLPGESDAQCSQVYRPFSAALLLRANYCCALHAARSTTFCRNRSHRWPAAPARPDFGQLLHCEDPTCLQGHARAEVHWQRQEPFLPLSWGQFFSQPVPLVLPPVGCVPHSTYRLHAILGHRYRQLVICAGSAAGPCVSRLRAGAHDFLLVGRGRKDLHATDRHVRRAVGQRHGHRPV